MVGENSHLLVIIALFAIVIVGSFIVTDLFDVKTQSSSVSEKQSPREMFMQSRDFYIYNYYKVPVDVKVVLKGTTEEIDVASQVPPGGRKGISFSASSSVFRDGSIQRVYARKVGSVKQVMIGESVLNIPKDTTIKSLHVGMSSGHEDLSVAGEGTKSTLGTALPWVRIVNSSPRCLSLLAGSDSIKIQPRESLMYFGEHRMGVGLGTVLRDQDGFLNDYVINKPITDLHLGLISDTQTPLYSYSKFGGDFDDTAEIPIHLLENGLMGGPHRGAKRDRSYIP